MNILLHITFACLSIVITGVTAFAPSRGRIALTAASIVLTVGSGVVLAIVDRSLIAHVCETGLVYLAVEIAGIAYSLRKLRRIQPVAERIRP